MPNVYLSKTEIEMLQNVITSYRCIMGEGEETAPTVDKEDEVLQPIVDKLIRAYHKPSKSECKKIADKINQEYEKIRR